MDVRISKVEFWLDDALRVVTEIAKRMESKRRLATRRLDEELKEQRLLRKTMLEYEWKERRENTIEDLEECLKRMEFWPDDIEVTVV